MSELLALAVGASVTIGLLFTEIFGIATGGLVVPGYMAMNLNHPWHLAATLGTSFATLGSVRALSSFLIVHGRRRTSLMILMGYFLGMAVAQIPFLAQQEFGVVGYIIPGLIALWMDRQGVLQTLASLILVTVLVRLVLMLILGVEAMP